MEGVSLDQQINHKNKCQLVSRARKESPDRNAVSCAFHLLFLLGASEVTFALAFQAAIQRGNDRAIGPSANDHASKACPSLPLEAIKSASAVGLRRIRRAISRRTVRRLNPSNGIIHAVPNVWEFVLVPANGYGALTLRTYRQANWIDKHQRIRASVGISIDATAEPDRIGFHVASHSWVIVAIVVVLHRLWHLTIVHGIRDLPIHQCRYGTRNNRRDHKKVLVRPHVERRRRESTLPDSGSRNGDQPDRDSGKYKVPPGGSLQSLRDNHVRQRK